MTTKGIKLSDLRGESLAYMLWCVEGGQQHKHNSNMWFFPRKKAAVIKGNWRPWELRAQAADLIHDHKLAVWYDADGWHGGAYFEDGKPAVFCDAETFEQAAARAAVGRHFGEVVPVPLIMVGAA